MSKNEPEYFDILNIRSFSKRGSARDNPPPALSYFYSKTCVHLGKHDADYLYKSTGDVLGSWKHYNLSGQTLNERNNRAKSPLVTRELDR